VPESTAGELSSSSPADGVPVPLPLSEYAEAIALHEPFDRSVRGESPRRELLKAIGRWLLRDAGLEARLLPSADEDQRSLIRRLLTLRPARSIPPDMLQMLDTLFADDASRHTVVTLGDVLTRPNAPRRVGATDVQVWRGDITTLEVDGIVNAANADMLGCFRPEHRCIDNAIHSAAGPRLREDCHRIMCRQGHAEPTGTAKATRAYYLPSTFVLHTVGPIVGVGAVTASHRRLLASSYESCLAVATEIGVRSLAFCAVSTGVFGYPKEDAAAEAIRAVTTWLEGHAHRLDAVIFNVFSEQDEDAYRRVGAWL